MQKMMGVGLMVTAVAFLLLNGASRLTRQEAGWLPMAAGALVLGIYGGCCLAPGLVFLGNTLWRLVFLGISGAVAFGFGASSVKPAAAYILLSLALDGLSGRSSSPLPMVLAAAAVGCLCLAGQAGEGKRFIPVTLDHNGKTVRITALRDTGNTLIDPVTGKPVLVADAQVAKLLTGLSRQQLLQPVETLSSGQAPGLRLVPYRTIDRKGMLLAMGVPHAKIGGRAKHTVVAFSPEVLGKDFQALVGGYA